MRWETARKKEIESSVDDPPRNSYPYGNHSRGTEICKPNWKSHTPLTSTDVEKDITRMLPPSYSGRNRIETVTRARINNSKDKIATGTDNGINRIAPDTDITNSSFTIGIDSDKSKITDNLVNKENEISITNDKGRHNIENEATVNKRDKDFNSNHETEKKPSEDKNKNEENGECACQEQKKNAPSVSPSDVETQLKKLTISVPEGELCEPGSVGSEKCHSNSCGSSVVSSKVLCNGGGIVAETPALPNHLHSVCLSLGLQGNIGSSDCDSLFLPTRSPEYPFGEASSSPLDDCCSKLEGEIAQNMTILPVNIGKNRIPNETVSAKAKIAIDIGGRNNIADEGPSGDCNNNEEKGEDECQEPKEDVTSISVSDVEIRLKNLEITSSKTKNIEAELKKLTVTVPEGELCERSPIGSEKCRRSNYSPYSVSSKVLCNGGGIVAETPALPNHLHSVCLSSGLQGNIIDSSEYDNLLLPLPSPEYPFGEASSFPLDPVLCGEEPPVSHLPWLQQDDLDAWLNDHCPKFKGDTKPDDRLGCSEITDLYSFQPLNSNYMNNCAEQNGLSRDHNPITLSHSPPTYRCTASIPSISSPSSGSCYSSECSTLSSPVSSPGDSLNNKSDSDTESELLKTELILQDIRSNHNDLSFLSTEFINNNNVNNLLAPNLYCNPFYSLPYSVQPAVSSQTSQSAITVHSAQQSVNMQAHPASTVQCTAREANLSSSNVRTVVIENNVELSTYTVPQRHNIQRLPVVPNIIVASGRERISAKLNKAMKDCALLTLAKLTDEKVSEGDEHGDTQLMILICNHSEKLEYIFAMVNRLKNIPGALEARNSQDQSALLLACLRLPNVPFVARFIAEAVFEKSVPRNEVYGNGNTLLHLMCAKGDSHVDVLAELVSMRDLNNHPCFDVNQHNHREGTPLHVAVKMHSRKINCSRTVAFLLSQGADILIQERSGGLTALHMAIKESCDPLLVQILLQEAERRNINLVNKGDYPGDTALHYVALRNDVPFHQQAKVVQMLILYGAASNRCGSQGRTPLALVSMERKNEIQKIIHKR